MGYDPTVRKSDTPTPAGLSAKARRWWTALVDAYVIEDPAGIQLATEAARALDRLWQSQKVLKTEGLTVTDRFGQLRPHPCLKTEMDSRNGWLACMRALNLDTEPSRDRAGRPPGSGAMW